MVTAGSGEYLNLSSEERTKVVSEAVSVVAGRVPVLAGVLEPGTRGAVAAATAAAAAGAAGLLVLPPYYMRPSLPGVIDHFRAVFEACRLPIVAYNNPGRTGSALGSWNWRSSQPWRGSLRSKTAIATPLPWRRRSQPSLNLAL